MTKYSGRVMEAVNEPVPGTHKISIYADDRYIPFITMFPGKQAAGSIKFKVELGLATASLIIPTETLRYHLEAAGDRRLTAVYYDYNLNTTVITHVGRDARSDLSFEVTKWTCDIAVMVMGQRFTVAVRKGEFLAALKTMEETYDKQV